MDRQVISYLKEFFCTPAEAGGFGWSNTDFAYLTSFFTGIYAAFTVVAGWAIDKIGTKLGLALSLILWSIFGILNAFAGTFIAMHVAIRSAFAVGEAGNFPASIKTVAEWFPKRERAFATGIFNSGSNFGAMIAALFVPWCLIHFGDQQGWKMAFILTGAVGFLWLIFWFWLYETPARQKRLSKAEYDYIHIDDETAADAQAGDKTKKVSWLKLFGYRQMWSFFAGKFMTDGVWWFYLFWLPDYLKKQFGMTKHDIMLPTFIVYGVAIIGSVYGGSIPMTLIKRGMAGLSGAHDRDADHRHFSVDRLDDAILRQRRSFRKNGRGAGRRDDLHRCRRASGVVGKPIHHRLRYVSKKTVASVIGIGTMAGGIGGGVILQMLAGRLTDHFKQTPQTAYLVLFTICGLSYLTAWSIMKMLVPRHKPITDL
jgi:ACS family hexuronate transporter-like MFS transporter